LFNGSLAISTFGDLESTVLLFTRSVSGISMRIKISPEGIVVETL
jgi:hypothetical protein